MLVLMPGWMWIGLMLQPQFGGMMLSLVWITALSSVPTVRPLPPSEPRWVRFSRQSPERAVLTRSV